MEPTIDIATAIGVQFSKPIGVGTFISEAPKGADAVYVVRPAGAPDATEYINAQVENYQQFDVYAFNSDIKAAFEMAFNAKKFVGCLPCLQQATPNANYSLKAVKVIGGVIDLGTTAEERQIAKFTVQITYLATC